MSVDGPSVVLSFFSAAQTVQKSSPSVEDLTADQQATVMKLANLQKSFGKKMNSPGVDLSLKEISRWRATDRTLVKYELDATGLPKDLVYSLLIPSQDTNQRADSQGNRWRE